jgi:soluble lytic murein transglycosylase-like protein
MINRSVRMALKLARGALIGLLLFPASVFAGDLYSYVDADGVMHFTNVPSERRYRKVRKVTRAGEVAGVYRVIVGRGKPSVRVRRSAESWEEHIQAAAKKYRLPVALLKAVMAVESNFDPEAVSEKGAVGLMQLMPRTAREMYVSDSYDPVQNIEGGARYLRILANQYEGDMVKTLAAYNAGPEAVRRSGGAIPDIPETREYVRKVVALYNDLKSGT